MHFLMLSRSLVVYTLALQNRKRFECLENFFEVRLGLQPQRMVCVLVPQFIQVPETLNVYAKKIHLGNSCGGRVIVDVWFEHPRMKVHLVFPEIGAEESNRRQLHLCQGDMLAATSVVVEVLAGAFNDVASGCLGKVDLDVVASIRVCKGLYKESNVRRLLEASTYVPP